MGLFDNLFLDKNTPMAINIGDPLGSETALNATSIAPAVPGGAGGGGGGSGVSGGGGSGGNPPTPQISPIGGGTTPLSGSSGGDTLSSGMTMIGNAAQGGSPESSPANEVIFDIGGDLGFSDPLETSGDSPVIAGDPTISLAHPVFTMSDQPAFIVSEVPTPSGSDMITPESGILEITPIIEISASSVSSTESPLMNLMSGFEKSTEIPEITIINPTDMPAPTPVTDTISTDGLFSLMDTVTPPPVTEAVTVTPPIDTVAIASITPMSENSIEDITIIPIGDSITVEKNTERKSEISLENHPMNVIGKELARMTRSPRLQGKLNGFIGELEELSLEEERLKDEKRKQIASYQTRIAELKTEYETRIHALELEEEDLKKQIIVMDEERAHITQVIYGFKQELEVV